MRMRSVFYAGRGLREIEIIYLKEVPAGLPGFFLSTKGSVYCLSCRAGEEKKGVAILQCFTMLQNRFTVGFDLHGSPMDRHLLDLGLAVYDETLKVRSTSDACK